MTIEKERQRASGSGSREREPRAGKRSVESRERERVVWRAGRWDRNKQTQTQYILGLKKNVKILIRPISNPTIFLF